jgi:MFS family permease
MERDLGASRAAVTGAFTIGMGIAAFAALPVGRWLDRHGPWGLMTLGSCLGTALLIAWSRVESLTGLYVIWTLMGLALAATLYEPAFGAVVRWSPPSTVIARSPSSRWRGRSPAPSSCRSRPGWWSSGAGGRRCSSWPSSWRS